MANNFVFIIPFRNVKNFIGDCANSILLQNNKNWRAIFCDDESSDNTVKFIPSDKRFTIRRNKTRMTALPNIHFGIMESSLNDEDIICILDGDDMLVRRDTLDILDKLYDDETLLTYGQYIWPNGQLGHCKPYTPESFAQLRNGGYWASHIRTFKYKLYKEIMKQDPELSCYKNTSGYYYTVDYDIAIMTPLMEIAGFDKIKFNPEPVYYYRIHSQNDHFMEPTLQKDVEREIFAKPKFQQIF